MQPAPLEAPQEAELNMTGVSESRAVAAQLERLESRLDIMHQEMRRTAETIQRLRLAVDGMKVRAGEDTELLNEIRAQLNTLAGRTVGDGDR